MTDKHPKRPRDANQLARSIVDIATGGATTEEDHKNKAAVDVATAKAAPEGAGDTWTWTAIDADTKLVMSWLVGGRDGIYGRSFAPPRQSRAAYQRRPQGIS